MYFIFRSNNISTNLEVVIVVNCKHMILGSIPCKLFFS